MSSINEFFKNQTVFILGGTGFLGKVLIEKLLRTDQISKIIILVRSKKGRNVEERFEDLFSFPCFERLKKERPEFRQKVVFVSGDCEQPNLGISKETEDVLIAETSIVIHAAANVKFDQTLKTAINTNVRSVKDCLDLAKKMSKLQAFIYVSTAYSNCPYFDIDETFYEPPVTPEFLLSMVESLDDDTLVRITPSLIGKWPNTYVFSKTIAENVIKSEGAGLPIGIIRPSIVLGCADEPMPGWMDNLYGFIGITCGIALGVVRSLYAKKDSICHIVPCDYISNLTLTIAWNVAKEKSNEIKIYNFAGAKNNLITWQKCLDLTNSCGWDYPSPKSLWYINFSFTDNKFYYDLQTFLFHTVCFSLVDFVLYCIGREPIARINAKRLNYGIGLTRYFARNYFSFQHENVDKIWEKMNDEDKNLYKFDMKNFDWTSFMRSTIIGLRVYLLKDPLDTIPEGHKKIKFLRNVYYFSIGVLICLLYLFLKLIFNLFF